MSGLAPSFDPETSTLTIPRSTSVKYYVNDERVKGQVVITEETTVTAQTIPPAHFREGTETEWTFTPGATQLPAPPQVADPNSTE